MYSGFKGEEALQRNNSKITRRTLLGSLQLAIDHEHLILCKCVQNIIITRKILQTTFYSVHFNKIHK